MHRRLFLGTLALVTLLASPAAEAEDYPDRTFSFVLLLDGEEAVSFAEVSGLEAEAGAPAHREGGTGQPVQEIPAQVRFRSLTLRHSLGPSRALQDWFGDGFLRVNPELRDVSLVLRLLENEGETEAVRWNLFDAWVTRLEAVPGDMSSGELTIDSVSIAYDRLERD